MVATLFFTTGVEGGLFTWLPYYATSELPADYAGVALSVMLAAYIPGRFLYGTLTGRVGALPLLAALVATLLPAVAFTFVVAEGLAILGGVAVVGLLVAGVYPTAAAYATDAIPEYSGPVNGLAAAAGSAGLGLVPAVMGVVVGQRDAVVAMQLLVVPLSAALVVLVVALVCR